MRELGVKLLKMSAVAGAAAIVLRLAGPKLGETMERKFENAPEDFPPKWMFINISAIRENTERILEALIQETSQSGTEAA
jgi:hypothetical protein